MLRISRFGGCAYATVCLAQETLSHLPQPHFHAKASDPPWLTQVVQFHGHLGPWVVAGARLGMAGRERWMPRDISTPGSRVRDHSQAAPIVLSRRHATWLGRHPGKTELTRYERGTNRGSDTKLANR